MSSIERAPATHTRVYKACWSCRQRKVKCDLGPVDSPHAPPCARCRRENRSCRFNPPDDRVHLRGSSGEQDANAENLEIRPAKRRQTDHGQSDLQSRTARGALGHQPGTKTSAEDGEIVRNHNQLSQFSDELDAQENTVCTSEDTLNTLYRDADRFSQFDHIQDAQARRVDKGLSAPTDGIHADRNSEVPSSVRDIWEQVVFIQDGLFTVYEALVYVKFFRDHMEPYSPIDCGRLLDPDAHVELLQKEPVLALTVLMIASRNCSLPGAGSLSRRFVIHERLWTGLQTMISRMLWAQDEHPTSKSRNRIRTIGTCEALLLLSDWHPRSLHFPEGRSGLDLLVSGKKEPRTNEYQSHNPESWMEWSWRSDRLSWSLLWTAFALASDLGVFGKLHNMRSAGNKIAAQPRDWNSRATRIQALLTIYFTQISIRIGARPPVFENLGVASSSATVDATGVWLQLSLLERQLEDDLFQSKHQTREIIDTGLHIGIIYTYQAKIAQWQRAFAATPVPEQMQCIMKIDLAGIQTRMYSISLQAARSSSRSGMASQAHCDEDFVTQMLAEARSLLRIIIDHLQPKGRLSHMPARIYLRILSAVMHLLKAIKIMESPVETKSSCDLIEGVGHALKNSSSDDAYLSSRWGDLIIALSHRERELLSEREHRQEFEIPSSAVSSLADDLSRAPVIPATAIHSPDEDFLSLYDPQTWVSFDLETDLQLPISEPSYFGADFSWR